MAANGLRESEILLKDTVSQLALLSQMLCEYPDDVPLNSAGLYRLVSHIETDASAALRELRAEQPN